jgi:TatD DNase family protein
MWIDVHAHLYRHTPHDLDAALRTARASGITAVVNTATDLSTAHTVIAQASTHAELFAVAGISPFDAGDLPNDWRARLAALCAAPRVISVGKCGIDATNPRYPPLPAQEPVFAEQLDLARELNLPVVIHSRGAEERAAQICRSHGITRALFHCFAGSVAALRRALDAGYYVSFSGVITFPNSTLDELVKFAPADRIFVESDAPYLAPVPHRGKPNCPAWTAITGAHAARLRGVSEGELALRIQRNFGELFGIRKSEVGPSTKLGNKSQKSVNT